LPSSKPRHGAIDELVRRKAEATEKDLSIRIPELDRLIAAILAVPETRPQPIDRPEVGPGSTGCSWKFWANRPSKPARVAKTVNRFYRS
jgi:hypothetical protein